MTRISWLNKIWKGSSKGVSTVVGTVFLMLIVLMVSSNVLLWSFSRNAEYNEAMMAKNEEESERRSENIVSSVGKYSVSGDKVTVVTVLTNGGSVAVQIVNLWILDTTIQRYGHNNTITSMSVSLNPGDYKNVSAAVAIPGADDSHIFNSWFLTSRGNTISLEGEEFPKVANLAQGIGYLALDFGKFRHFTYESTTKLANYPNGTLGFDAPAGTYVAFGCYVTNLDPDRRTITIDSHSLFFQPGRTGISEGTWFIVNANDDGTINGTYSQITLEYREEKMLVFASSKDLGIGAFARLKTAQAATTVNTFLILHGTVGSIPYGQSIPYVSIFYS